ncbi:VanZ family protein [Lacihabitans sp. LS3-19]|uniref:VanZ family protein n=1 Tax=Lacihabitans sp. LS3-19 TaxID=2487335 RepID=UPI0020CBBB6E|nr:VanZ family protein [Lacihabitans sp. LS3-19]MCP9768532.1 VanZ family protein [Lacihabitans sp. LS3-19]
MNWKEENDSTKLTILLFSIYLAALAWILIFKLGVRFSYMEQRQVNLIPFVDYFSKTGKLDLAEVIMNIFIFIPLGVYAAILFKRWFFISNVFFFFLTSLLVESIQFVFKIGAFDSSDIITNTFGGIIGFFLFQLFAKVFNSSEKAQKITNVIAGIATFLMIIFLILLKTNQLGVRYQ